MTLDQNSDSSKPPIIGKKPAIRYVEARRVGTCAFADRIATLSIQHYHQHIDERTRTQVLPQTCIATIVAVLHVADVNLSPSSLSSLEQQQDHLQNTPPIVDIKLLSMGVGTKFLSEQILKSERERPYNVDMNALSKGASNTVPTQYGTRIRDCHAEVLCRRAFRKYLFDCIEQLEVQSSHTPSADNITPTNHSGKTLFSILQRYIPNDPKVETPSATERNIKQDSVLYQLRPDVTLHMYCSSTPCGNSTIKKFASLQKEVYCANLSNDSWPSNQYNHLNAPVVGHSIPLGQFALLVKKDNQQQQTQSSTVTAFTTNIDHVRILSKKERAWPIYTTTDWCPPGTTTVWSNQGSIHTCSDKMARWNYLGYQGSLLSKFLHKPIYVTTVTIGRKFSSMTCRRAICCRLDTPINQSSNNKETKRAKIENKSLDMIESISIDTNRNESLPRYHLHHPTVMGTSVYMDESGVIDMSVASPTESIPNDRTGGDDDDENGNSLGRYQVSKSSATRSNTSSGEIRFHSPLSFVTCLQHPSLASSSKMNGTGYKMECIDGSTGFLIDETHSDNAGHYSMVCTLALMKQFMRLNSMRPGTHAIGEQFTLQSQTLRGYRELKRIVAGPYEHAKDTLLTKHPVFRDWKRHDFGTMDKNAGKDREFFVNH